MAVCTEAAARGRSIFWGAPTFDQVRVCWDEAHYAAREVAMFWKSERTVGFPGGGRIIFRSLDNPDNARGHTADGIVIDEAADVDEAAWYEVLRPTLISTGGWAWIIGTPKGRNWFWREFVSAGERGDSVAWNAPTLGVEITERGLVRCPHPLENPDIPFEEVLHLYRTLPERVFRQEILAEFIEDSGGVFRGVRDCIDAGRKENDHGGSPYDHKYFMGVDLGRVDDFTVIDVFDETGRQCWHERFNQISWPRQIAAIEQVSGLFQHPPCVVDATGNLQPNPIVTELSERGVNAIPFIFTNTSKAQIIDSLAIALEHGRVRLMDVPVQTNELLAYQYEITPSRMVRMAAPSGMHDDCVSALALAHWALAGTGDVVTREAYQEW